MPEVIKRIITSLLLILFLIISINSIYVLFVLLIICCYEIFYEFFSMIKKIFISKNKINLYIFSLISLIYITFINLEIFNIFLFDITKKKETFYLIVTICISTDVGGYVFGKIFKGKKLSKISPNKTMSGSVGSIIFSSFTILILSNIIFMNLNYIFLIVGIFSSISCQLGDLFFSYIKRKAKLKDTGNFLPGHGGILDRLDGILVGLPIGFITLIFLFK